MLAFPAKAVRRTTLALAVVLAVPAHAATAQSRITTPKEHFGLNMADDYKLRPTPSSSRTGAGSRPSPTG